MFIISVFIFSATIPDGWPMFRCNQQRTGFIRGYSNMDDMYRKYALLVQNSEINYNLSGPVCADFNNDNQKDILLGSWSDPSGQLFPSVSLYRGYDGSYLWGSHRRPGSYFGSPCLMDINNDNKPEIFLAETDTHRSNPPGFFTCLDGRNGSVVWIKNVPYASYSAPLPIEGGSGLIIVGDTIGNLRCFNATNGNIKWVRNLGGKILSPSYGDVDNDNIKDIVVSASRTIFVFDTVGTLKWSIDTEDSITTPALANFDTDPALEIVVYNYIHGRVKVYNYGNSIPILNVDIRDRRYWGEDYVFPPSPAIGDFTGDGINDIIIHNGAEVTWRDSIVSYLYCINGATNSIQWEVESYNLYGSPTIANLDIDPHLEIIVTGRPPDTLHRAKIECYEHTGRLKWRYYEPKADDGYPDPILNEAAICNIDDDPQLEIATVDYSCWFMVFDSHPLIVEEEEKLSSITVPTIITDKIEIFLAKPSFTTYRLNDISGRILLEGTSTTENIKISTKTKPPGIYFLNIKTESEEKTFKLIKL